MPRACPVEFSRLLLFGYKREPPTAQGRGIRFHYWMPLGIATIVILHGTSPWHHGFALRSDESMILEWKG